jgi:ATP-dependent DNA helicase PIF1
MCDIFAIENKMAQKLADDFKLTVKQRLAYDYMVQGKNVFITGPSGTGKSSVIKLFKKLYGSTKTIAITSTTGISALLIGGTTLHSYAGIGMGTGSVGAMSTNILKKPYLRNRWAKLDVLIIDEVSMLSPELFDKLEEVGRIVRRSKPQRLMAKNEPEEPFGGIQIVLSGDFLQLPVVKSDNFCFEAKSWDRVIPHTVNLTKIIRQDNREFQKCLNNLRFGRLTRNTKELLMSCVGVELKNDDGIKPTRIHTTNAAIDQINEEELDKLVTEDTEFVQFDMEMYLYEFVKNREWAYEKYRKYCLAPSVLQLCIGAQVMLLHNLEIEEGLVNGSRGVVVGFVEDLPRVKFLNGTERIIDYHIWEYEENDKKMMRITQIPLKLAWAVTVHKSQGQTLDYAEVDLSNVFEYGQAYVALSRVKSKEGLSIVALDFDTIRAHPKAKAYYKKLKQ